MAVIALSLCYPFMIYWGLQFYEAKLLLPVLLILLGMRWVAISGRSERYVIVATLVGVASVVLFYDEQLGLKFYPVMMSLGFLVLFGSSLFSSVSFVERLARIRDPNLSEKVIAYTRKVTWVWSGFFLLNGTIAAMTALWATDKVWMLYNGMIAYLLMGILAAAEWLVRQRVKRA